MHSFLRLWLLCALVPAADGQDRHDWQSLARLQPGDRVGVSLNAGPVTDTFQSGTPQDLTVGTVTARRDDVLKIERYRHGGSRAMHTAIGALIGFGGGFAIGAAGTPCYCTTTQAGAVVGGAGAVIGGVIGVLLPTHSKEVIYSSR